MELADLSVENESLKKELKSLKNDKNPKKDFQNK